MPSELQMVFVLQLQKVPQMHMLEQHSQQSSVLVRSRIFSINLISGRPLRVSEEYIRKNYLIAEACIFHSKCSFVINFNNG